MLLAVTNPNFSIVVPSGCNANCRFCFWKPTDLLSKYEYLYRLEKTLALLPEEFKQCSITGGEPTTCSFLPEILAMVSKRFDKVVLSTNGYNVTADIFQYIDHLNISRHQYDEELNFGAFGTDSVPTEVGIQLITGCAHHNLVDVTLNCVLDAEFDDIEFIHEYIAFAKKVGVDSVCFRKVHSDLGMLPVESNFTGKVTESGCPVCKTRTRYVDEMLTTWRYGVLEPHSVWHNAGVFELVFQPNGILTTDWEGKEPLVNNPTLLGKKDNPKQIQTYQLEMEGCRSDIVFSGGKRGVSFDTGSKAKTTVVVTERTPDYASYTSSGCGSSGCGSSGIVYGGGGEGCGAVHTTSCG